MTEDEFFERLHRDAQQLRFEPADNAVWTRLQARIKARIQEQASASQLLARWFRPVATILAVLSVVAALSVQWLDRSQQPVTVEAMATAPSLGESFGVQ